MVGLRVTYQKSDGGGAGVENDKTRRAGHQQGLRGEVE